MAAKYKLGEDGKPVFVDGKLVLVQDDGTETPFDAIGVYGTLGKIRSERDEAKALAEAQSAKLKAFGASDEELEKAKERLKLARALDDKKLVDAGKVEEVVDARLKEATQEWAKKEAQLIAERDAERAQKRRVFVNKELSDLPIWKDYTPATRELFLMKYGEHFDVGSDDQIAAFRTPDRKDPLFSLANPNERMSKAEAVAYLIKLDPNHDSYKKSSNPNGSDAPGNRGGAGADALEQKSPEQRLALGLAGGKAA